MLKKYSIFLILIFLCSIVSVSADCTKEEIDSLKKEIDDIKITYKHLGVNNKEDGSKIYNRFMVTAVNVPENVYVHLSPMTEGNFIEDNNELRIVLTTGTWDYNMYSAKCDKVIKTIKVKLPIFNIHSINPLCEGIDDEDFGLCGKYAKYEVNNDTFERKVKIYRRENKLDEKKEEIKEMNNLYIKILNFITEYRLYISGSLAIILIILLIIIISKKRNKKDILE